MTRAILAISILTASAYAAPSRGDLAHAYMQVERGLERAGPLSDARRKEVNQRFDRATLAFFSGATERALTQLRELAAELEGRDPALAQGLTDVSLQPALWAPGSPAPVLSAPGPCRLELVPLGADAPALSLNVEPGPVPQLGSLAPGVYRVDAQGFSVGRFTVCRRYPEPLRELLEARLARLEPSDQARILGARLRLLTRDPDPADTTQVLCDLPALSARLEAELEALEQGRDPYRGRVGSTWRPLEVGGREVGLRVYAPQRARAGVALPLVIAFHGAGGDENMWTWGYGRGRLLELAESQGFLLATPRTEVFLRAPGPTLAALLASLADDYRIDRGRVFGVGHSLGVMALDAALGAADSPLAGSLCFSGAPRRASELPRRVYLGGVDPLVPARAGEGITILPGYGHTLGVGPTLDEGIDWLLGQPGFR